MSELIGEAKLSLKESNLIFWVSLSALYLFFVADASNKLLLYLDFDFNRISIFVRFFYELVFLSIIFIFLNKVRVSFLKTILALLITFLFGQIVFKYANSFNYDLFQNLVIFNKYIFVFIIYFALYKLKFYGTKFLKIIHALEFLFVFNSILALAGLLFGIDIFRTYITQDYRYGYSGLIPVQNESTMFVFLSISFLYYKHFILGLRSYKIWIVLVAGLILGTKGIYLFLFLLMLFHIFYRNGIRLFIVSILLLALSYIIIYYFLQTESGKLVTTYFKFQAESLGFWQMLLSGRGIRLEEATQVMIVNWNWVNYFFGGQDQTHILAEMDFFDLFFFFGIVGFSIIMILYFTSVFKFGLRVPYHLFFVTCYFLIAMFAGHFFTSAINGIYLFLVCLYFEVNNKQISWKDSQLIS